MPRPASPRASAQLVQHIVAGWRTQALHAAVTLGVPDALAGGAQSPEALAEKLQCHADALQRLLRALCTLGVCRERADGRYALTAAGRGLCTDPPEGTPSLRDLVRWWGGPLWPMWAELAYSVRTGRSAREKLTGDANYGFMDGSEEVAAIFHRGQQAVSSLAQGDLVAWPGWRRTKHVVDVGGGHGQVGLALAAAHPRLRVTLFDLPHAQAGAEARLQALALSDRCRFEAGSFFERLPAGADVYLLKSILHNWDDARCRSILQQCAAAAPPSARLLIVERVRPERPGRSARDQSVVRTDLNMLAGLGGRERSEVEYATLLAEAGFGIRSCRPLSFEFSVVEADRQTLQRRG